MLGYLFKVGGEVSCKDTCFHSWMVIRDLRTWSCTRLMVRERSVVTVSSVWGGDGQTACLAIRYTIFVITLLGPFGLLIAAEHNNFPLQRNWIMVVLSGLVPDRLQGPNWIFPKRPQVGLEWIFSNTKCLYGADMVSQDGARLPSARYGQSDYSRWTENHLKVKFGQACFKDKFYNTWFQVLLPE